MKLISADKAKCIKCRACAEVCPMGVINISAEGFPEPERDAFHLCINCGYCVDICVAGALSHRVRKRASDPAEALKRYEIQRSKRGVE